jgi:hypothetical protein
MRLSAAEHGPDRGVGYLIPRDAESGNTASTALRGGRAEKIRPHGQAVDHENRKTSISKPAANAQRPSAQAETTRPRLPQVNLVGLIRHCNRSPLRSNCWGRPLWTGGIGPVFSLNPNSGPVCPACNIGVALFAGLGRSWHV